MKMDIKNRITRYGAYGVVLRNTELLVTLKKSGPYKGLWDLPGGGIEFGESPEKALRRELLEEAALKAGPLVLLSAKAATTLYEHNGMPHTFHHVGILYKVTSYTSIPGLVPEDECAWISILGINPEELTPFVKYIYTNNS